MLFTVGHATSYPRALVVGCSSRSRSRCDVSTPSGRDCSSRAANISLDYGPSRRSTIDFKSPCSFSCQGLSTSRSASIRRRDMKTLVRVCHVSDLLGDSCRSCSEDAPSMGRNAISRVSAKNSRFGELIGESRCNQIGTRTRRFRGNAHRTGKVTRGSVYHSSYFLKKRAVDRCFMSSGLFLTAFTDRPIRGTEISSDFNTSMLEQEEAAEEEEEEEEGEEEEKEEEEEEEEEEVVMPSSISFTSPSMSSSSLSRSLSGVPEAQAAVEGVFLSSSSSSTAMADQGTDAGTVAGTVEEATVEKMAARERRRLRERRRSETQSGSVEDAAAAAADWRGQLENRWATQSKSRKARKDEEVYHQEFSFKQLVALGTRWYMVRISGNGEKKAREAILEAIAEHLPDREFELRLPIVRIGNIKDDGSVGDHKKRLYPGVILLRTLMDKKMYDVIRKVRKVSGFHGDFKGNSVRHMVMPQPVRDNIVEEIFNKMAEHEAAVEKLVERVAKEKEELIKKLPKRGPLKPGAAIEVVSGPFAGFSGTVEKIKRKEGKVEALLWMFGRDTPAELNLDQVMQAEGKEKGE